MSEDKRDHRPFLGRVREGWRKTVGHYATDEGETKNLLSRLVDFGHLSKDEASRVLVDLGTKIEDNRRELDARVDESVRRATAKLRVNSRGELESLAKKLGNLEDRMSELER